MNLSINRLFYLFVIFFGLCGFGTTRADQEVPYSIDSVAIVREGKHLHERPVLLKDLLVQDRLDGRYFKIVQGETEDPVTFVPGSEETLRASTVYHQLTVAREYAKSLGYIDSPNLDRKIVVRLGMIHSYNSSTHFGVGSVISNNSLSVQGSGDQKADGIPAWNDEIWFFNAKKIKRKAALAEIGDIFSSKQFTDSLVSTLLVQDVQGMSMAIAQGRFSLPEHLLSMAYSVVLGKLLPKGMGFGLSKMKQKIYLDTAMIPEIIYHEYGHFLFGHRLGYFAPTQLVEGFPNYFAAKVAGRDVLADHDSKYGKGTAGKSSNGKDFYNPDAEHSLQAAFGTFAFSVLMQLDKKMGPEGERILFRTVLDGGLDSGSMLVNGFDWVLNAAIVKYAKDPEWTKIKAQSVLEKRGM